eukprot:gnl/MRDRNA2_/MRDRNA2_32317_c0_seq1.p1 gnl/MRDRNA2_/MRDRNA2_32317_c0~~gnl/MRDRNA2_/MRDRNA2_32317_c0_seq1.p1  ORF type:complete len:672 (+),score=103.06 gnl/MRDRNA2_/MRDRNA2_32317_c0_seq1:268-2016(+)
MTAPPTQPPLRVVHWNLAGPQNNPFEFWMEGYGAAAQNVDNVTAAISMVQASVENYMVNPAINITTAFGKFFPLLVARMKADANFPLSRDQENTLKNRWRYLHDKTVWQFLTDKALGVTRILSMPDRKVGDIKACNGTKPKRPTLIACHDLEFQSIDAWWAQWLDFMFGDQSSCTKAKTPETKKTYEFFDDKSLRKYEKKVYALAKNPDKPDEDIIVQYLNNINTAVAMQTMMLAIFDAILMQGALSSAQHGQQPGHIDVIRKKVCEVLVQVKDEQSLQVLDSYLSPDSAVKADVVTLVEASSSFPDLLRTRYPHFLVFMPPELDAQNSLILINPDRFQIEPGIMAGSLDILKEYKAEGELTYQVVMEKDAPRRYLMIASYHANTEGTASTDVIKKLHEAVGRERLLIGMDANTQWQSADITQEDVCRFYVHNKGLALRSIFQDDSVLTSSMDPSAIEKFTRECTLPNREAMCKRWYDAHQGPSLQGQNMNCSRGNSATTMKVRSMVNAQPTKGVKRADMMSSDLLDMNPKDHIVYSLGGLLLRSSSRRNHLQIADYDRTAGMPSVSFPSDHALLEAEIEII